MSSPKLPSTSSPTKPSTASDGNIASNVGSSQASDCESDSSDKSTSSSGSFPDTAPLIEFLQGRAYLGHSRVHVDHLAWNWLKNGYDWQPWEFSTKREDLDEVLMPFGVVIVAMTAEEFANYETIVGDGLELYCKLLAGRDQALYHHILHAKMVDCMVVDSEKLSKAQMEIIAGLFTVVEELERSKEWSAAVDGWENRQRTTDAERWLSWVDIESKIKALDRSCLTGDQPVDTLADELLVEVIEQHPSLEVHWQAYYKGFISTMLQYPYHKETFKFSWMDRVLEHEHLRHFLEERMEQTLTLHALIVYPAGLDWPTIHYLFNRIKDRSDLVVMQGIFYPHGRRNYSLLGALTDQEFQQTFENLTQRLTDVPFCDISTVIPGWILHAGRPLETLLIHLTLWVDPRAPTDQCLYSTWVTFGSQLYVFAGKNAFEHWERDVQNGLRKLLHIVERHRQEFMNLRLVGLGTTTDKYLPRFQNDIWFDVYDIFVGLFGLPRYGPLKGISMDGLQKRVLELGYRGGNVSTQIGTL